MIAVRNTNLLPMVTPVVGMCFRIPIFKDNKKTHCTFGKLNTPIPKKRKADKFFRPIISNHEMIRESSGKKTPSLIVMCPKNGTLYKGELNYLNEPLRTYIKQNFHKINITNGIQIYETSNTCGHTLIGSLSMIDSQKLIKRLSKKSLLSSDDFTYKPLSTHYSSKTEKEERMEEIERGCHSIIAFCAGCGFLCGLGMSIDLNVDTVAIGVFLTTLTTLFGSYVGALIAGSILAFA